MYIYCKFCHVSLFILMIYIYWSPGPNNAIYCSFSSYIHLHNKLFLKIINQVVAIARAALDGFKNEAKKMVVVIVDMERAFVQTRKHHFVCFCFFLALSVLVA